MANATTLPILTIGREVIQGGGSILGWTGMLGAAPALEQRFEERVGVIVRQFIYAGTLGVVDPSVRDVLLDGVSGGQARWPPHVASHAALDANGYECSARAPPRPGAKAHRRTRLV